MGHVVYYMIVVVPLTASGLDGQEVLCCHMAGEVFTCCVTSLEGFGTCYTVVSGPIWTNLVPNRNVIFFLKIVSYG